MIKIMIETSDWSPFCSCYTQHVSAEDSQTVHFMPGEFHGRNSSTEEPQKPLRSYNVSGKLPCASITASCCSENIRGSWITPNLTSWLQKGNTSNVLSMTEFSELLPDLIIINHLLSDDMPQVCESSNKCKQTPIESRYFTSASYKTT